LGPVRQLHAIISGCLLGAPLPLARRGKHGCENGFDRDGDVLSEDSYIHDLYQSTEAHTDGAQITPWGTTRRCGTTRCIQTIIDNHFSTLFYPPVGAYGPWTDCEDEIEVHGDVYHESGEPLPGQ
jgi:hypothetical protein